VGLKEHKLFGS